MPRTFGTAAFLVVLAVLLFGSARAEPQSRTLYDDKGREIGRSITRGGSTTFKDEKGREIGRSDRRPDGTTTYRDEKGRIIGSSRGR
jgi:hypothetical protein